MDKITLFANSLGHGGSERQAAFIGDRLARRGWDVRMVCVLGRDDYASPVLRERTTVLGKRGRGDFLGVVERARRTIDPTSTVLSFNWYPAAVAARAVPDAVRIVRYGGTPSADGVTGIKRLVARGAQRGAAAVVGCSWGVVRQAVLELGSPRLACAAIPNAVYSATVDFDPRGDRPWPRPYIIAAGRLSAEKDHATMLDAFARIAGHVEHDLLIAGDGALQERIERQIARLGLGDRVHLLGYRKDLQNLIGHADLLVHTSRWEGFGIVLIEAMRLGVPVVTTDAPYGPRAVLEMVPGGVLVPVGAADRVASEVLRLLRDADGRARLGVVGRNGVPVAFGPDRIIGEYERLIRAVAKEGGR